MATIVLLLWQTYSLYWKTGKVFIIRWPVCKRPKKEKEKQDEEFKPEPREDLVGESYYQMQRDAVPKEDKWQKPPEIVRPDVTGDRIGIDSLPGLSERRRLPEDRYAESRMVEDRRSGGVRNPSFEDFPEGIIDKDLYEKWRRSREDRFPPDERAERSPAPEPRVEQDKEEDITIVPAVQLQDVPERYETIAFVERENPHKAEGVTFDGLNTVEKILKDEDPLTQPEEELAMETMTRLRGTNMERMLMARIEGSSEKIRRNMDIFLTGRDRIAAGETSGELTDKDILDKFRIEEMSGHSV